MNWRESNESGTPSADAATLHIGRVVQTPHGYMLEAEIPSGQIVAGLTRLRWSGDDLHGELRVVDEDRELLTTEWVLTKPASRRDVLHLVGQKAGWREVLNTLARDVIAACRMGNHSPVMLSSVAPPPQEQFHNLVVLPPVLRRHINIWFGDGGTGKSFLALFAAGLLAQQGIRVLYLDWELDEGEHRRRLEQLFGRSSMPEVLYWHCQVSLPQLIETLRGIIAKQKIEFLVVDSIGFAVHGAPEISSTANEYTGRSDAGNRQSPSGAYH